MSWSRVILFGDSLTEFSLSPDGQWASLLGDRLKRVADVIVRGFGGYNSKWCRLMLPKLFPETFSFDDVSCFVILLGTNDSSHLECPSKLHVPIDEYKDNLKAIVQFLVDRGLSKDKVIFMNPPPTDVKKAFEGMAEMLAGLPEEAQKTIEAMGTPVRTDERTAEYSQACLEAGEEIAVDTVNLHEVLTRDSRGSDLLVDGIHFSADGSKLVFEHLWPLVEPRVLKHAGMEKLTQNFPDFLTLSRSDPESIF
ncbi:Isoamyl acetate-hydrolyzing esterase 1 -like protein [Halotydeus destructor]|nr:Isoamyl acetate-hydrolyzing esterase 1 -like protein [Halotydeus destructor]